MVNQKIDFVVAMPVHLRIGKLAPTTEKMQCPSCNAEVYVEEISRELVKNGSKLKCWTCFANFLLQPEKESENKDAS